MCILNLLPVEPRKQPRRERSGQSLDCRGSGVAVFLRNVLELSHLSVPAVSSFEYLAFKSKSPSQINTVLICRPTKLHPAFIAEIHDHLTSLCSSSSNNIIHGDLNIHIDKPSSSLAADFIQILDCLNLAQYVDAPPHTRSTLWTW